MLAVVLRALSLARFSQMRFSSDMDAALGGS